MSITVRDVLRLNEKLLTVQAEGGGFPEICRHLGEMLDCQVIVTDVRGKFVSGYPNERKETDSWFVETKKEEKQFPKEKEEVTIWKAEQEEIWGICVYLQGQCIGYAYIIGSSGQFDEVTRMVCRQMAGHFQMEFAKKSAKDQDKDYKGNNFFMDLISDNVVSEEDAIRRARGLYWPQFPMRMAVSDIDDFESVIKNRTEEEIQSIKDNLLEMQRELLRKDGCFFIGSKSDSFHCLFSKNVNTEMIQDAMAKVQRQLQKSQGISVTVGVSREISSFSDFKRAYRETRTAVKIGKKKGKNKICFIEGERMEEAFYEMAKMNIFQKYVSDSLEILEEYDQKHGSYLVDTVKVLTENLGARKETADALYLHRNTLTHRIRRIEQLIGADLDDPEVLFSLYLAVKIRTYMK